MVAIALTLGLVGGCFFPLAVFSAEPLFSTYLDAGSKLVKENKVAEGLAQLEQAQKNSEHLKDDDDQRAKLYDALGLAYCRTGKQTEAEDFFKKALVIRQSKSKKSDIEIFGTLISLATVYRNTNRFVESEELYKKGLAMFAGKGPIKSLCQATVLYALGTLYLEMSKPAEAQTVLEKSLQVREQSMFKASLSEQGIYDALGRAFKGEGRLKEAQSTLEKALALAEKNKQADSIAYSKANLASVYAEQARYADARSLFEASLKSLEQIYGMEGTQVATVCSNLAEVSIAEDRYAEAEALLTRALTIHTKLLGLEHTSVAYDLSKLVSVLRNQGKYDQAQTAGRRCVEIFSRALGRDKQETAQSLNILAGILGDEKKYQEAEPLFLEAIAILKNLERPLVQATVLLNYGEMKMSMGEHPAAKKLLWEAASILESRSDSDPSNLARVYSDLAGLDTQAKLYSEAEVDLNKALALREKIFGRDHVRVLGDLRSLEKILNTQKKTEQASLIAQRIAVILEKNPEAKEKTSLVKTVPIQVPANLTAPVPVIKNRWALVIGVSNFEDPDINLRFAAKDAVDFASFLTSDAKFPVGNVKVLVDKDATRDNIIKQLGPDWLGRRAGSEDLVVIYISSHGSTAKDEAGGVNFLVAHDTKPDALLSTGIPMQWLSQIIKEQVHSKRVVLILDVCHSGASASSGQKGLIRENNFDLAKVAIGEGQAIICSSAPEQVSWESKTYSNSVFTRKLIEGLKLNAGRADLNQAFSYLKEEVEAEVLRDRGKLQTPIYFSKNWQGPPPVLLNLLVK
jgi:tetratricopeptide (TPR) repeat protein